MRSHPYQPQAPIVSELADYIPLPNRSTERHRRGSTGGDYEELDDLDPDTSRLLPTSTNNTSAAASPSSRLGHHVMVQGRLAVVRSVSVAGLRVPSPSPHNTHSHSNLPSPGPGPSTGGSASARDCIASPMSAGLPASMLSPRGGFEDGVGGAVRPRRHGPPQRDFRRRTTAGDYMDYDEAAAEDCEEREREKRGRERDRQFRGYGIGGAGNIRRPTDITYSSSRRRTASSSPDRRRWKVREFLGLGDRKGKSREAP